MTGMTWYYIQNGVQQGPVDQDVLGQLLVRGLVSAGTWVWRPGLSEWMPYGAAAAQAEGAEAGPTRGLCAYCGSLHPRGDLVTYRRAFICPACKPVFLERLRDDRAAADELTYGGFGARWLAVLLDWALLAPVSGLVSLPILWLGRGDLPALEIASVVVSTLLPMVLKSIYEIWMIGRYGATLGKMACRLRVVNPDGERISYLRSTGRHFAKYVSGILMYLGYLVVLFDEERRTLHDYMCDTRVIRI